VCPEMQRNEPEQGETHLIFLKNSLFHHFPLITGDQTTLLTGLHHHAPFWELKSELLISPSLEAYL